MAETVRYLSDCPPIQWSGDDRHSDAGDLAAMSRKAVFLDKDGTLIEDHPFDRAPEHIKWMPGTSTAYGDCTLWVMPSSCIQSGRNRTRPVYGEDLLREELGLRAELAKVPCPRGILLLPHHPDGNVPSFSVDCYCRKPNPGLLIQAARELDVDRRIHGWSATSCTMLKPAGQPAAAPSTHERP